MSRIFELLRRLEEGGSTAHEMLLPGWPGEQPGRTAIAFRDQDCAPDSERLIVTEQNHLAAAEAFRRLRYQLEQSRARQALTTVLVTSAVPREGKTLVALNLALTLALAVTPVLLVDGDLRQPGVPAALGLPPAEGLAEALERRGQWRDAVRRVRPYGVYYLPAGVPTTSPGELLASAALRALLQEAARGFAWVIVDSPPLAAFADSLQLASAADGVLLVGREGVTPEPALRHAIQALQRFPLLGLVLNGSMTDATEYYHGYTAPQLAAGKDAVS
ncbi:MAG: CpsD/CapB family tyrosine-protein kinase [Terriglobales bacterium]